MKINLKSKLLWYYFFSLGFSGVFFGINAKMYFLTPQQTLDFKILLQYPNLIEFCKDNILIVIGVFLLIISTVMLISIKIKRNQSIKSFK